MSTHGGFVGYRRRSGHCLSLLLLAVVACGSDQEPVPLRIALAGDPSSLDPHLQSEVFAQSVLGNVYETLVTFDVNLGLEPSLAERWENPDDLTLRLHLRDGVRFHDGRPLTATDVAYSFERARRHPRSKCSGLLLAIADLEVLDDRTIELRTATYYPILLNKLAFFYVVPTGAPAEITRPIGTGPYRFVASEPGRLSLAAFAGHWRGAPAAERVEFHFVSRSQERVRRLLAGELDVISDLAPQDVAIIEDRPGFRIESRSGLLVAYLQMDLGAAPFADPRVRQAIDLAFDRQALVDEMLVGKGQPSHQMVSPNVFGYAPELPEVSQDIAEARRLLAAGGYPEGLDLDLEYRAGRSRSMAAIRAQLAAVGIRVRLVPRPWSEMYPRLLSGQVRFYFGAWNNPSGDASDLLDQKVHSADPERGYGASNSNHYADPELDALIEQSATMAMDRRGEVLRQALTRLAAERVFIPLYTPYDLYGVRAEIAWVPRLDGRVYAFEMQP